MPEKAAEFSLPSRIVSRLTGVLDEEAKALSFRARSHSRKKKMSPPCPEDLLRQRGFSFVPGVDEAGRGPLAGPVVAAAVVLDAGKPIEGLRDSKQLTPNARLLLYHQIRERAAAVGVGTVTAAGIDRWNILVATEVAMARAVAALNRQPDWVLVDGKRLQRFPYHQIAVIKGDRRVPSIAAASIVAKVFRDRLMVAYHAVFPVYQFARHKAYPTKEHAGAILRHGPSPIHRMSFHVPGGEGKRWTEQRSAAVVRERRSTT